MFEHMTYESILEDMLKQVTNDVDKREGSVIYDALAPCAYQLAQAYFNMDNFIDLVSGDTAVAEYLDRIVADYGITRKAATYAVRKVTTNGAAGIGTRWGLGDTTYVIKELLSDNVYSAICEQIGEIGNQFSGDLENIDNVNGVTATLTDIINGGQDEESDDNLRARLFAKIQLPTTSGNANHYKQWAMEVAGVGDAKVYPLWNGPGTVKVLIVDSDKQPSNDSLITQTQDHINTMRPIGSTVTVVSGIAKELDITATVVLAEGYNIQTVINTFATVLSDYLKSIAFTLSYVSYAKIGTILLSLEGVLDYKDLKINDMATNIPLDDDEIPVLGSLELES